MLRSRVALAAVTLLVSSLTGCAGSVADTAGTAIELPEWSTETPTTVAPEQTSSEQTSDEQGADGGTEFLSDETAAEGAAPTAGSDGTGAAQSATIKDCVIVAAGVSSILLAPLSLMGATNNDKVDRLHDQIDDLRSMVPPELAGDFDRLQDVVAASTRDGGSFDESAYRAAVAPIEEWLHQHCSDPHD